MPACGHNLPSYGLSLNHAGHETDSKPVSNAFDSYWPC